MRKVRLSGSRKGEVGESSLGEVRKGHFTEVLYSTKRPDLTTKATIFPICAIPPAETKSPMEVVGWVGD